LPWQELINPYQPMQILSAEQVEAIHQTSLRILEELGIEIMSPRALEVFRAAGAEVDFATGTVRIDRGLVNEALATVPSSFTLTPRNLEKRLVLGTNHIHFGLVAGPPNVHDCERGGALEIFRTIATSSAWRSTSTPST
jgi:trimethylamine--corrinoid protein Co-methyltransferase